MPGINQKFYIGIYSIYVFRDETNNVLGIANEFVTKQTLLLAKYVFILVTSIKNLINLLCIFYYKITIKFIF